MAFGSWFLELPADVMKEVLLLMDSNIEPMNHKATLLSTDPAGKLSWQKKFRSHENQPVSTTLH